MTKDLFKSEEEGPLRENMPLVYPRVKHWHFYCCCVKSI